MLKEQAWFKNQLYEIKLAVAFYFFLFVFQQRPNGI
jgi:hypothetical protein